MNYKKFVAAFASAGIILTSFAGFALEADIADEPTLSQTPAPFVTDKIQEDFDSEAASDVVLTEAEDEEKITEYVYTVEQAMISSYDIYFDCVLDGWPRKDYANFNIYSKDGVLLASHTEYIAEPNDFSIHFTIPDTPVGEVMYLEVTGVDSVDYYSDNYILPLSEYLPLYSYATEPDENGDQTIVASAYMTAHMRTQCPINIYVDGSPITLSSPAIFDDSSIVAPLSEIAEAIGITDCTYFPNYNSVRVEAGDHIMYVNVGQKYYSMYDNTMYFNVPVQNINSLTYVELRHFVEAFGSTLEYADFGDYCEIYLSKSPKALESISVLEQRANESGLSSKTDYMIWINKEKFRLAVFEGSKGNWKHVKDFTVGIGAPSSETITGVYEYQYYVNMWPYTSYYVGPIMVFQGNYAIHSTFLNYDGTPYDNTVGAKVSHGCVRCQAKYIKWLTKYMPVGTRIYITEN